jgi:hypothetical protein
MDTSGSLRLVLTVIGSTGVIDVDWEGPVARALLAVRDEIAHAMDQT